MWGVSRRLIVVVSVLAFVSGMTTQALPSAQALGLTGVSAVAKADPECPRMAMEHPQDPAPLPCRGIVLDCVKQMGCLGTPALPDRSNVVGVPVAYSIVAYCAPCRALLGRNVEPDLFPPIAS
jgi:hypothetical protein